MSPQGEVSSPITMLSLTSTLAFRFSWIAASLVSVAVVLQWQGIAVAGARKAARIAYPQGELWRPEYHPRPLD